MIVPGSANSLLLAQGAATGYNLNNSLRFRSSASAYLNRTPASASNRQTWTWSGWVKRGTLGTIQYLFGARVTSTLTDLYFNNDQLTFEYYDGTNNYYLITSQVFRDPSAWYHIVATWDTTQATSSNRMKLYVNGVQVTALSSAVYPTQNLNGYINSTYTHYIGQRNDSYGYFDGYMAEQNFIDGSALSATSFGQNDATTGVWQPKAYTGTYGTNGFYLPFTDTTSTTTLGYDFSGNSNNWTTNNFSLTTGSTYDSMTDVPTLTDASTANYAVLNPLSLLPNNGSVACSNGNLKFTNNNNAQWSSATSTIAMPPNSSKFYCEVTITSTGAGSQWSVGVCDAAYSSPTIAGFSANSWAYLNDDGGSKKVNNSTETSYGVTYTSGDIIGIAVDYSGSTASLTFYKNNSSQGVAFTGITGNLLFIVSGASYTYEQVNFGQQPFTYTPPTDYVALNTYNLPDSTIVKGNTVMDATIWTGSNSSGAITVTNAAGFKPDFVWGKVRSTTYQHQLYDSVRGVGKLLQSNTTNAEQTNFTYGYLSAFNSNGFTAIPGATDNVNWNETGQTYVAWQWQAGQGTTSSNTNGSITSTVSVNPTAGFSIVTYTGTLSSAGTATVGHGLGVAPSFMITKARNQGGSTYNWGVFHSSVSSTFGKVLYLNTTGTGYTFDAGNGIPPSPTSTTFGTCYQETLGISGVTYVAYCWAEIAGFSKFGSYTGNGSSDGTFIYTGFRPKFVLYKRTDTTGDWYILDTSRSTYNAMNNVLFPNASNAEDTGGFWIDGLSNGFKQRGTGANSNANGGTYIYAAFAENPFKNALAR